MMYIIQSRMYMVINTLSSSTQFRYVDIMMEWTLLVCYVMI